MKQRRRHDGSRDTGLVISIVLGMGMALGLGCSRPAAPSVQEHGSAQTPGEGADAHGGHAPDTHAQSMHTGQTKAESAARPAEASEPHEDTDAAGAGHAGAPEPAPPETTDSARERRPGSEKSFDELLTESRDAAAKGQYGRARKLCEEALDIQPREPRAVSVCATAACGLGNARLAKRYYDQSVGDERRMLRQLCSSKGIELPE